MRRVTCSMCHGDPEYRTEYGCKCTDCSGIGSFEHWRNRKSEEIQAELTTTRKLLEEVESELRGSGETLLTPIARELLEERRAYWKYRVQALSLEFFEAE